MTSDVYKAYPSELLILYFFLPVTFDDTELFPLLTAHYNATCPNTVTPHCFFIIYCVLTIYLWSVPKNELNT